jgi:hypothetical protein
MLTPQRINLRDRPELDQNWLHNQIVANPAILGLEGDFMTVWPDQHLIHNVTGKLTIRLVELTHSTRYFVHLKYGRVDDKQIVRLIDGWGDERRSTPQYGHVAVLVAEEVDGTFWLNALKTLGDFIPLIVIELKAYMCEEGIKFVPNLVLRQRW